MSPGRELQVGDLVEFRRGQGPWGRHEVVGVKSAKTLWVRYHLATAGRFSASRRRLVLLVPVEERVAEMLMETGP